MAKVEIETMSERCHVDCPFMRVDTDEFVADGVTVVQRRYCANLAVCIHAVEVEDEQDDRV